MLNVHDEQFYKLQLKWAADNFDAEHRMRLAAEERAGARGLLMDVVVHLLASELEDVSKKENVALWTDAQLVRWMKDQLGHHLMQLRFFDGRSSVSAARTGHGGDRSAVCRRRTRNAASRTN